MMSFIPVRHGCGNLTEPLAHIAENMKFWLECMMILVLELQSSHHRTLAHFAVEVIRIVQQNSTNNNHDSKAISNIQVSAKQDHA